MYHNLVFLIHLLMDGGFKFSMITNKATMNMTSLLRDTCHLNKYAGVELLDCRVGA